MSHMSIICKRVKKEEVIEFLKTQSPQELAAIKELLTCSADENDDYNDLVNKLLNPPIREVRIKDDRQGIKIEFLSITNSQEEIVHDTWCNLSETLYSKRDWAHMRRYMI